MGRRSNWPSRVASIRVVIIVMCSCLRILLWGKLLRRILLLWVMRWSLTVWTHVLAVIASGWWWSRSIQVWHATCIAILSVPLSFDCRFAPASISLVFVTLQLLHLFIVLGIHFLHFLPFRISTFNTQCSDTDTSCVLHTVFVLHSACLLFRDVTFFQSLFSCFSFLNTLVNIVCSVNSRNSRQSTGDDALLAALLFEFLFIGTGAEVRIRVCFRVAGVMGFHIEGILSGWRCSSCTSRTMSSIMSRCMCGWG